MKQKWAAAERNKAVILETLRPLLPATGTILEIASGTGQHTAHFAAALTELQFRPTDFDANHLPSIDAWCRELPNVAPATRLDVTTDWRTDADAVYCANMIHIAPFAAAEGLFAGLGRSQIALFLLYGPFRFSGAFTAPSNAAFDERLKTRDSSWGVRDTDDIDRLAGDAGLTRVDTIAMPANNHLLVFRRA